VSETIARDVLFTVKVDQAQAARGVQDLAAKTKAANAEAGRAEQTYRRLGDAAVSAGRASPFAGGGEAGVSTLTRERARLAYDAAQARRNPAGGAAGRAGGRGEGVAGILGVGAAGAAAFAIAGGGLQRGSAALDEVKLTDSYAESVGKVVRSFAEGVPILGGFVKGMHDLIYATERATAAGRAEFDMLHSRQLAGAATDRQMRSAAAETLMPTELARFDAANRAGGVGLFAGDMRLPGYSEVTPEGVQTGAARYARDRAAAEEAAAERQTAGRTIPENAAAAALAGKNATVGEARQRLVDAQQLLERGKQTPVIGPKPSADEMQQRAADVAVRQRELADALNQRAEVAATLLNRQKDSQESLLNLAQKQRDARQAEIGVLRTQLDLVTQQEERVKGGALSFATSSIPDQQALLDATKQLKDRGFDTLTREQQGMLGGNALTQRLFEEKARESASANPVFKQLLAETGNKNLADLAGEKTKLQQEITLKIDLDEQKFAAQVEKVLTPYLGRIKATIEQRTNDAIEAAKLSAAGQNNQPPPAR
jgi:hypothetical protein